MQINSHSMSIKQNSWSSTNLKHIYTSAIDAVPVECVNTFNLLGIMIDQHLSWNAHIDKLAGKIATCTCRSLVILNKLKNI